MLCRRLCLPSLCNRQFLEVSNRYILPLFLIMQFEYASPARIRSGYGYIARIWSSGIYPWQPLVRARACNPVESNFEVLSIWLNWRTLGQTVDHWVKLSITAWICWSLSRTVYHWVELSITGSNCRSQGQALCLFVEMNFYSRSLKPLALQLLGQGYGATNVHDVAIRR